MRPRAGAVLSLMCLAVAGVAQLPWIRLRIPDPLDGHVWTVQWANGEPAAKVRVYRTADYERGMFTDFATTGDDGSVQFRLPTLPKDYGPPQIVWLAAVRDRAVSIAEVPGDKQGGTVRLGPTTHFRLHLVDAQGQPASGVKVTPQSLEQGKRYVPLHVLADALTRTSDAQGVCDFAGLPKGGDLTCVIGDDRFESLDEDDSVPVGDAPESEATLKLQPGAVLDGRAVDAKTGEPIAKVVISAHMRTGRGGYSSPTGTDGKYHLAGLRAGLYMIQAHSNALTETRIATAQKGLSLASGERKTVDVQFVQGVTVEGKVVYRNTGHVAAGVQVGASVRTGGAGGDGFTKNDGTFSLVVAPGKYDVFALAPKHNLIEPNQMVAVEAVDKPIHVDLVLPFEPFAKPVTGTVVGEDGKPVPNAEVVAEGESGPVVVRADADGRFEVPATVPAPAKLRARKGADCSVATFIATTADQPVTLKLAPKAVASIEGKVANTKGEPMAKTHYLIFEKDARSLFGEGDTDATGHFAIASVWPNTSYVIFANRNGYAEASHQQVDVKVGEKKALPTLVMHPLDRTITGRVLNDDGDPVQGVVIDLGGGRNEVTPVTDKDGRFMLKGVPREELHLHAQLRNLEGWKSVPTNVDDVIVIVKAPPQAVRQSPAEDLNALVGKPAPALAVKQWLNGGTLDLSKHRGKIIVLDFWGTSCSPCVAELPAVRQFADQFSTKGVIVVGVHYSSIKPADLRAFLKQHDVRMPVGLDSEAAKDGWFGRTFQTYGVMASPCFAVIDREGKVALMTRSLEDAMALVDKAVR